ncbi:MAG: SEC-C domain-containing protein [Bacteroidales bacterium]|nr:SEC-C domain-containing protein [Bacteroidales bacterium]
MERILVHALTRSESKIVNVITTPVEVKNVLTQASVHTNAIWDTGATSSVVTKDLATQLGLIPMGKTNVRGVHGVQVVNTYFANLTLNNTMISMDIVVTECDALSADNSIGMLVGMDVITKGDFSVTNYQGKTVMSFRVPSIEKVDYVAKLNAQSPATSQKKVGRNEPCPCGSGKKYKQCCGKNS